MNSETRTLRAFTRSHGPVDTYSAVDCEVHQNLVLAAQAAQDDKARRRARLKGRVVAVAIVVYAIPLYVLAELLGTRGRVWNRLEHHLDQLDDRLTAAETACYQAGDERFVSWLGDATDGLTDAVCRMAAPLTRG